MITVLCVPDNLVIFDRYLSSSDGAPLRPLVRQVTYAQLFASGSGDDGAWIFTGVDRLTPAGREAARLAAEALGSAGARVLNHPSRMQLRYDLLRALHASGVNRFRAARLDELAGLRYPVFLREENQHSGNLTPLLQSEAEVRHWCAHLQLKGFRREELLAVEFLDTSRHGIFRKYSAFYVDGRVLARHAQASTEWMIKAAGRDLDERYALEERRYLLDNPDRDRLAPIFTAAGIDYGRMDYGWVDDQVQVWEINSAPTIGGASQPGPRTPDKERYVSLMREGRQAFYRGFADAMLAQDRPVTRQVAIEWPAELRARVAAEAAAHARVLWRRQAFVRATHLPVLGAVITALGPATRGLARRLAPGRFG